MSEGADTRLATCSGFGHAAAGMRRRSAGLLHYVHLGEDADIRARSALGAAALFMPDRAQGLLFWLQMH